MKRMLLILSIVLVSLSASAQRMVVANEPGCLPVVHGFGKTMDEKIEYVAPPSSCVFTVRSASEVDVLSTKLNSLDAEVHATIDKRFDDLSPKMLNQVNGAVAKKLLTADQLQAIKLELHKELTSELSIQLQEMKKQIEALKAAIEANKGH